MRKFFGWLAFLVMAGGALPTRGADAPMAEIVVAMRYFQQDGTSHSHLYLYREDGKLLRQLTDDNTAQDRDPSFSPDGKTIVFTRVKDKGGKEYWSIEPRGGRLHILNAAPPWYTDTKTLPTFGTPDDEPDYAKLIIEHSPDKSGRPEAPPGEPLTYRAPDGSVELVLKVSGDHEDDAGNGPGHGKSYEMRDLRTGESVALGTLPGFLGLFHLMAFDKNKNQRFLLVPPLRVAFFALHLGSTDGDTAFALDLEGRRLVPLSPNWAEPIPLPGQAAFLTWTENRYVPFGDGKRTANCSYIERWDAKLQKIRYAKDKGAGDCYGASMYRPGKTPAMLVLRPAKE